MTFLLQKVKDMSVYALSLKEAENLIKEYDSRDPEILACELGIKVYDRDDFKNLKGMYFNAAGKSGIFLNSGLNFAMRRTVLAHELGHAVLHSDISAGEKAFTDSDIFREAGKYESEANIFAAELLIADELFIEAAKYNSYTCEQIAAVACTDINLVLYKASIMHYKGVELDLPLPPKSDFLA